MRKKLPPRPLDRSTSTRELAPTPAGTAKYASVLAQARRLGLVALTTIAPLGALVGTVSACGGAAPVVATPVEGTSTAPPVTTIAPPAAPSSSAPVPPQSGQTE